MFELEPFPKAFKGDIVTPSDADYEKAIARWAINACRKAKVVAFVKDAEDVSLAIKYAKAHKLPIAIRGGGHSSSGASSIESGLVVDLSRYLNSVKVDAEKRLGYCGGGALWETVDKTAIEHGLATVAGTVNHTGVGGLLLGGGFGWLSGAYGLVIDNLVQATVVTADGSVLTANETSNPDLFWALKGGGSNFGVCTEFVLKLHPQRRTVFAGPVIFPLPAVEELVTATNKWWANGPSEKEAMIHVFTRGLDKQPRIIVIIMYNGTEAEGRESFKFLYELGPVMDLAKEIPYEVLNTFHNEHTKPGIAYYIKGVVQTKPVFSAIQAAYEQALGMSASGSIEMNTLYEYFPAAKISSVPAGSTAYRRRPGCNVLVLANWTNDTPENLKAAREGVLSLADLLSKSQVDLPEVDKIGYGNYDYEDEVSSVEASEVLPQDKAQLLFAENYPKLQVLKKKYDPECIFSKWFVITPAA